MSSTSFQPGATGSALFLFSSRGKAFKCSSALLGAAQSSSAALHSAAPASQSPRRMTGQEQKGHLLGMGPLRRASEWLCKDVGYLERGVFTFTRAKLAEFQLLFHPTTHRLSPRGVPHFLGFASRNDCNRRLVVLHDLHTVELGEMRCQSLYISDSQASVQIAVSDVTNLRIKLGHGSILEDVWLRVAACPGPVALLGTSAARIAPELEFPWRAKPGSPVTASTSVEDVEVTACFPLNAFTESRYSDRLVRLRILLLRS